MTAPRTTRNAPAWVTALLVVVGLVLIVIAVIYFAQTAADLPSFFPGHEAGSAHHHTKHGIAALIVGLLALAGAWMSAGKSKSSAGTSKSPS